MRLPPAVISAPLAAAIFFFPVVLFFGFLVLCPIECDYYWALRDQEGIFEHIQAVFYFAALLLGLISAKRAYQQRRMPVFWILALFSVGAFFVLGKEIAWGQGLFGFTSPEFFQQHNQQGDMTLHNIRLVESGKWHHKTFLLVGLYGAFAWLTTRNLPVSDTRQFLRPVLVPEPLFSARGVWRQQDLHQVDRHSRQSPGDRRVALGTRHFSPGGVQPAQARLRTRAGARSRAGPFALGCIATAPQH
jgi:hypothetical protein